VDSHTSKTKYFIIEIIYNLVLKGGESGRSAVGDALTPCHRDILYSLQDMPWPFDWMEKLVQQWILKFLKGTW
jgi:hypothetical protein